MGGPPDPPGPRGVPGLGVLPWLGTDAPAYSLRMTERYGPVVRLPVPRGEVFLLTSPAAVDQVLVSGNANHWKGRLFGRTSFLFGDGLVLADGPGWQERRRAMSPALSAASVAAMAPVVEEVVDERLERWAAHGDGVVPLEDELMQLTLAVVARTLLGLRLSQPELERLTTAFGAVLAHLGPRMATFALPDRVPVPGERRARRALAVVDALAWDVVEGRRGDSTPLLEVVRGLPPQQGRDEVVTLLFGGYEATAHGIGWAFALLGEHPDVDVTAPGAARQVAAETLRLHPPFWEVLRSAYAEQEVDGHRLPAGASILLVPWVTHRLPQVWDEPLAFRPERFAPGGEASRVPRSAYFPFGTGQRACIGKALALLEMEVVLTRVAARWRLERAADGPVRHRARSTLRSRDGLPVRLVG